MITETCILTLEFSHSLFLQFILHNQEKCNKQILINIFIFNERKTISYRKLVYEYMTKSINKIHVILYIAFSHLENYMLKTF